MYHRYAIYVTPTGTLADAGAAWLGWDMATGSHVPHPSVGGLDIAAITKRPRKYGLHATIKPPMVLAKEKTEADLIKAAEALAETIGKVYLDGLTVSRLGRFLALTGCGDTKALDSAAAQVVETLDPFRAPLTPEELTRRRQKNLTPSQEKNLTEWGYPNVMEDFRFHITLTGPLKDVDATMPIVAAHFAPVLPAPFVIDHLTVVGEDATGMFHNIARLPLAD